MKTKILSTLLLGVIFLSSCEEQENEILPPVYSEGKLITIEVYSPSLEGNLLGDPAQRDVNIYLPKGYNESLEKRYSDSL